MTKSWERKWFNEKSTDLMAENHISYDVICYLQFYKTKYLQNSWADISNEEIQKLQRISEVKENVEAGSIRFVSCRVYEDLKNDINSLGVNIVSWYNCISITFNEYAICRISYQRTRYAYGHNLYGYMISVVVFNHYLTVRNNPFEIIIYPKHEKINMTKGTDIIVQMIKDSVKRIKEMMVEEEKLLIKNEREKSNA